MYYTHSTLRIEKRFDVDDDHTSVRPNGRSFLIRNLLTVLLKTPVFLVFLSSHTLPLQKILLGQTLTRVRGGVLKSRL